MGRKAFIFIIIIIILAVGGYYLFQKNQAQAPTENLNSFKSENKTSSTKETTNPSKQIEPPVTPPAPAKQFSSGDEPTDGVNIQVVEVDFDGAQFTPAITNIKVNDWVFFKNKSTVDFWPASNPHPTHTDYPEFDSKKAIAPGAQFKFQFTKAGNWGFHDHLNPSIHGSINVTK